MAVDPVLVRELRLYLENEPKLFSSKKDVLRLLLAKKGQSSDRLWVGWVREGAELFAKDFGEEVPREVIQVLARQFSLQEEKRLLRGDYDGIKLAGSEATVKKTATINEALSHLTLARVAETSAVLEGSSKKGTDLARKDLHKIVRKVASLAESSDFDSLEVQASLFDLVAKAETIHEHFSKDAASKKPDPTGKGWKRSENTWTWEKDGVSFKVVKDKEELRGVYYLTCTLDLEKGAQTYRSKAPYQASSPEKLFEHASKWFRALSDVVNPPDGLVYSDITPGWTK